MDAQAQRGRRRFLWRRWLIIVVVLLLIITGGVFWVFYSGGEWFTVLPVVLFTALGIVVALFQWLFPVSSDPHDQKGPHSNPLPATHAPTLPLSASTVSPTSLTSPTSPALSSQPIFVPFPHPVSGELPP